MRKYLRSANDCSVYDELIAVLNKLNKGCLVHQISKQWRSGAKFTNCGDVISESEVPLSTEVTELLEERSKQLGRIVNTLTTLCDTAADAQKAIRIEISSRKGFNKLPDELVLYIISEASWQFDPESEHRNLGRMAGVCRRFRNIINSHAPFWTYFTNKMHPERVKSYLARSKAAPLSLFVEVCCEWQMDGTTFFKKLLPHCRRWRSVEIDYTGCFDDEELWPTIKAMHTLLGGELHLPTLESLTITLQPDGDDDEEDFHGPSSSNYHLYTKWQTLKPCELSFHGCLPSADISIRLTHCNIFIGEYYWRCPEDPVKELMAFLARQPTLEYLCVEAVHFTEKTSYRISDVVELPVLRSLTIGTPYGHDDNDIDGFASSLSMASVMEVLKLPNVEELSLRLAVDKGFRLEKILPRFNDYAKLKKLHLYIFTEGGSSMDLLSSPLTTIFTRMRKLEKLLLGADKMEVPLDISEAVPIPPLRRLILTQGSRFTSDSLISAMQYLQRSSHWHLFESLWIPLCPQLHDNVEWYSSLPPYEICEERCGVIFTFNHDK